MAQSSEAQGSGPGSLANPRARRTIRAFMAYCQGCDEKIGSPRQATAHATVAKHVVIERKSYTVAMEDE